jgi:hypothetical protein
MPNEVLMAEIKHRNREIEARNDHQEVGVRGNSGQCHIVVAKSRCVGSHRVEVCVCHGLLSSQAVLIRTD